METKRKTDLFRFATVRAPQLISKERRKLGFVENIEIEDSEIFVGVNPNSTLDVQRAVIQSNITGFTPFESVEEIKGIDQDFWDFSLWLAENRNVLVRSELDTQIGTLSLTNADRCELWDQIYYDILTEKNPYVRQACIQMLVADNFIRNYTIYSPNSPTATDEEKEAEAKLLKRLANGKLVIHAAVTRKKSNVVAASRSNHLPALKQEEKIKAQVAALKVDEKRKIEKDLIALKNQYIIDYEKSFKIALSAYNETVRPVVEDYLDVNPSLIYDENIESLIPENLVKPFRFDFDSPLSTSYTSGKISTETERFIANNKLHDATLDEALKLIDSEKTTLKVSAANVIQRKVSEIVINGVQIKANKDYKEFALLLDESESSGKHDLYFSMDAGYKGAFLQNANFIFTVGTGATSLTVVYEDPCMKPAADGSIFMKLNLDPLPLESCLPVTFSGNFQLNNGESYSFEKNVISSQKLISGRAYIVLGEAPEKVIYGVNKIGVVDYRKVEQELCCYVPGEVSHIENIMAKEYKDRSTRSLTRVEQSIETTSDREAETSSDTTTTSRDELSTEVAKIIEKERNTDLGFNAQASGGSENTYKWNIGGSSDFSFGQSSSNSNSIARTKAQELTQRALERVVQKVSSTRTSKMLQEFEDSSSHGFDNRKGSSHVTGIYRWVDKVYKNRIVNYGKRLIYEFMIPEPSRWYKEAIIVEKEENDTTSTTGNTNTLVAPVHPKDHQIFNAESITRENYSQLASHYGIDIVAPMDRFKSVSESYAESVKDNKPHSYNTYTPVTFPDGYVCTRIKGNVSGYYKSTASPYAYLKIGAGTNQYVKNFGDGKGNYTGTFDYQGLNYSPSAKITISTMKVDSVNLSVEFVCELAAERFKQWQQDAYATIMETYNQQLAQYNDAVAAAQQAAAVKEAEEKEDSEATPSNSKFNSQIINTELKRLCIEMLTAPFGHPQGKDLYLPGECKVPKVAQSATLDEYASQVKFFEQAFDWDIISEMFYPYYWAKKCDWKALFQSQDSGDLNFQAFLQSGMARIMVPVREGFEDAVVFYMETGKIWNGTGLVVDTDDELYLSIVDEMTEVKGFTEGDEWEVVVPSDLTIIQAKSAFLEDEGLPCCHDNEDLPVNMKFQGTDVVLTAKDETETPEEPSEVDSGK